MIEFLPERTVALTIGSWSVHWYGVFYVLAFVIAAYILPRLQKYRDLKLTLDDWLLVLIYAMVGVIIGGRLGYVLLYNPGYYWQNPLEVVELWRGGMASHGGFIGVAMALWLISKKLKINKRALFDIVVIPAASGLALGRIGNVINQEMAGAGYEIWLDLLTAAVCWWHLRQVRPVQKGRTGALFLILYGLGRFILSFWRELDGFIISLGALHVYESQLLTLPIASIGAWLWQRWPAPSHRWYATKTYGEHEQNPSL